MADTIRSLTALQTLLANNSLGAISAQDLRDVLITDHPQSIVEYEFTGDGTTDAVTITAISSGTYTYFLENTTELFVQGLRWYRGRSGEGGYTEADNETSITPSTAIPDGARCMLRFVPASVSQ